MTTNIDIQFRYAQHPTEDTMRAVAELYDVSSSFAMETIKYTTALPTHYAS